MRSLLLLLLSVTGSAAASAQSWERFRGPSASGIGEGTVPATWSDSENLVWRTELPGAGSSSPVVSGNQIFLTAYSGYGLNVERPGDQGDLRLHVLCLSFDDGRLLWERTIEPSEQEQAIGKRVAEHGYATPTPCVDDQNVYAAFGPSGVVAFTRSGEFLWRRSVGVKTAGFGAAASPITFGDLVIMNASIEDDAIYGIDKQTGEVRWRTSGIQRSWSTPTIVEGLDSGAELVVNQKGSVLGLDPVTGSELWSCQAIQDYIVPCVIHDGATLYCSGGRQNMTFAIRAGGRGDVTESHLLWQQSRGANVTTPVLLDGYLYWSHDKAIALCLRASDGEEMFRERLPTRARVYASIVSDGEKLFLTTRDAGVLVLAAGPDYRELAVNRPGASDETFNATPAVTDGCLLLRSNRALYCIGRTTGTTEEFSRE